MQALLVVAFWHPLERNLEDLGARMPKLANIGLPNNKKRPHLTHSKYVQFASGYCEKCERVCRLQSAPAVNTQGLCMRQHDRNWVASCTSQMILQEQIPCVVVIVILYRGMLCNLAFQAGPLKIGHRAALAAVSKPPSLDFPGCCGLHIRRLKNGLDGLGLQCLP